MPHDMIVRNIPVKHDIPDARLIPQISSAHYACMNLAQIRQARGLTQGQLAEMAGIEQSTISKIEGGFDGVTIRTLKRLASALGVELGDLFSPGRAPSEAIILDAFRALPPERQQGWLDMAVAIAPHAAKDN